MPEYTYNSAPRPKPHQVLRESIERLIAYHERRLETYLVSITNWDKGNSYKKSRDYDLRTKMIQDALDQSITIATLRDVLEEMDGIVWEESSYNGYLRQSAQYWLDQDRKDRWYDA